MNKCLKNLISGFYYIMSFSSDFKIPNFYFHAIQEHIENIK